MKKPIIGVLPLFDIERDSLWMVPNYMNGLSEAGALPVMLPLTTDPSTIRLIADSFDGFLFTGGQDIDPKFYNEERSVNCGENCNDRDNMEMILFREVLSKDKPLLGICRGIQALNVFCGGTLYQDLPTQRPSDIAHNQEPPYDSPVHRVELVDDTPLKKLLNSDTLGVNSKHHQAINVLSNQLEAMAYSEDGLIEAIYMPEKRFVWAVQWHPELLYRVSKKNMMIFEEFVGKCKDI